MSWKNPKPPTPPPFNHEFHKSLEEFYGKQELSDFTIVSQGVEFPVHSFILAAHSEIFKGVVQSSFKEGQERKYCWDDYSPKVTKLAISFMYHFHYDLDGEKQEYTVPQDDPTEQDNNPHDIILPSLASERLAMSPHLTTRKHDLATHAAVFMLADAYLAPGLARYAAARFEASAAALFPQDLRMGISYNQEYYPHARRQILAYNSGPPREITGVEYGKVEEFFEIIPFVYENQPPKRKGLRRAVVKVWNGLSEDGKQRFGRDRWEKLIRKIPELGADLAVGVPEDD